MIVAQMLDDISSGRDLAFHLEICTRRWFRLALEPRTFQSPEPLPAGVEAVP